MDSVNARATCLQPCETETYKSYRIQRSVEIRNNKPIHRLENQFNKLNHGYKESTIIKENLILIVVEWIKLFNTDHIATIN